MISGDRWQAIYEEETTKADGKERTIWHRFRVAFFDNDGDGWIVDIDGNLRVADSLPGFDGYQESERIIAVVPLPPGVRLRHTDDDGNEFSSPLGLWGLRANGDVRLLKSEDDMWMVDVSESKGFVGLEYPDESAREGDPSEKS